MTDTTDHNPFAPPDAVVADISPAGADMATPFFPVSTLKLFVLSICTFGFYEVYWFYKNWQLIKDREQSSIVPVLRALFSVLFCYALFARIRDFGASGAARLAAGPLAAGWIITTFTHRLPDPYWVASLLAVLFLLLPVQAHINAINLAAAPDHDTNSRFSVTNWIVVGLGALMIVLSIVGLMLPG